MRAPPSPTFADGLSPSRSISLACATRIRFMPHFACTVVVSPSLSLKLIGTLRATQDVCVSDILIVVRSPSGSRLRGRVRGRVVVAVQRGRRPVHAAP